MNPADLAVLVRKVTVEVLTSHDADISTVPENPTIERLCDPEHGDHVTNIVTQLGKRIGIVSHSLTAEITTALGASEGIDEAIVTSPDFVNIRLISDTQSKIVKEVLAAGEKWGHADFNSNLNMDLEFVSTNPIGSIHLGDTRWVAIDDVLGRIPSATDVKITREYYFDDHSHQIDRFSGSLAAAARNQPTPEDGYGGEYIRDIAAVVLEENPQALEGSGEEVQEHFHAIDADTMFEHTEEFLREFGTDLDIYFYENPLPKFGQVETAVNSLKESGKLYEADGAWWLKSIDYGDGKDRVIIKSDGDAAYTAGDIAYVKNKLDRDHNLCIYMLGTDHHGHIAHLRATAATPGYSADGVEVLIGQMVSLLRDGKAVRMSKRADTAVALDDLAEPAGVDATRYSLIRSPVNSSLDIDPELRASQSSDSLVYYVQYDHVRLYSTGRRTEETGMTSKGADFSLLVEDHEGELVRTTGESPAIIKFAADLWELYRIARYVEQFAGAFHRFYNICQTLPKTDEEVSELHRARLGLAEATRQALANALQLLGVTVPERMQPNTPAKLHPVAPSG